MRYWRHVPGIGEGYDGDALWAVEMWEGEKSELRTSQIYMISISHLSGGGGNARMATCALSRRQYSSVNFPPFLIIIDSRSPATACMHCSSTSSRLYSKTAYKITLH